jgi:hypothetical protein
VALPAHVVGTLRIEFCGVDDLGWITAGEDVIAARPVARLAPDVHELDRAVSVVVEGAGVVRAVERGDESFADPLAAGVLGDAADASGVTADAALVVILTVGHHRRGCRTRAIPRLVAAVVIGLRCVGLPAAVCGVEEGRGVDSIGFSGGGVANRHANAEELLPLTRCPAPLENKDDRQVKLPDRDRVRAVLDRELGGVGLVLVERR